MPKNSITLWATLALLVGCAAPSNPKTEPAPQPVSLPTPTPVTPTPAKPQQSPAPQSIYQQSYETGHVVFVNRIESPNLIFHLRGKMKVNLFESYVIVETFGTENERSKDPERKPEMYIIPRERLLYVEDATYGEIEM